METVYIICFASVGLSVLLIFIALFRSDKKRDARRGDDMDLPTFAIMHKVDGKK